MICSGGCLWDIWRESGVCLEGVREVSGEERDGNVVCLSCLEKNYIEESEYEN